MILPAARSLTTDILRSAYCIDQCPSSTAKRKTLLDLRLSLLTPEQTLGLTGSVANRAISRSPFARKVLILTIAQGMFSAGSNATTRVHHATRWRGYVAACFVRAAAWQDGADRISGLRVSHWVRKIRGSLADRSARSRLCRGQELCYRVPMGGGPIRSALRAGRRAYSSQRRCHRDSRDAGDAHSQAGDLCDSDRHGDQRRRHRDGSCHESRAARSERHGIDFLYYATQCKTTRIGQGGLSARNSCGGAFKSEQSREQTDHSGNAGRGHAVE